MKKTDWKYLVDVMMFLAMVGILGIGLLMAFILKEGPAIKESDKFFLGVHRHQWGDIHLYLSLAFAAALLFHLILEWSWIKGKSRMLFKGSWRPVLSLIAVAALLLPVVFWIFTEKNAPEYASIGFGRGDGRGRSAFQAQDRRLPALPRTPSGTEAVEPPARLDRATGGPSAELPPESPYAEPAGQRPGPDEGQPPAVTPPAHEERLVTGHQESDPGGIVITGRMTLRQLEAETGVRFARVLRELGLPTDLPSDETLGRLRRRYGFTLPQLRAAVESLMEKKQPIFYNSFS